MNSGEVHCAAECKVLIRNGRVRGEWAICGASLVLARGRVDVMELLNGVVWNGGHTTKLVRIVDVPNDRPTYVNAVVPRPSRKVFPRRTPLALIDWNALTVT